jgi:hypothetical protein
MAGSPRREAGGRLNGKPPRHGGGFEQAGRLVERFYVGTNPHSTAKVFAAGEMAGSEPYGRLGTCRLAIRAPARVDRAPALRSLWRRAE